jgi:hypothetical protein
VGREDQAIVFAANVVMSYVIAGLVIALGIIGGAVVRVVEDVR